MNSYTHIHTQATTVYNCTQTLSIADKHAFLVEPFYYLFFCLIFSFFSFSVLWTLYTLIGEYSCLKVDLLFKREFSYYLIQIYIPCCMLVIVSWVSFWLDQGAVPARVSLGKFLIITGHKILNVQWGGICWATHCEIVNDWFCSKCG